MAQARVFIAKVDDIRRSGGNVEVVLDAFVFVNNDVHHYTIPVTVAFAAGTFKANIRTGIENWITANLGDTVQNLIFPDMVPL